MNDPLALISVTTFMKSDGLRVLLQSLLDTDYDSIAKIHIADDNAGARYQITREGNPNHPFWKTKLGQQFDEYTMDSAVDVWEDMKGKFDNGLSISYGNEPRAGISVNKNRGIYYYLNKTQAPYLLLIDDDIRFIKPGLIEEWAEVLKANTNEGPGAKYSLDHLTGYWSDIDIDPDEWKDNFENGQSWSVSKKGWFDIFPVEALGEMVEWRKGCMGVSNFYTRKAVEAVQYYDLLPGKYGYEHSLHTSRVMLKVNNRSPQLFPIYDYSEYFFVGQAIPNNYSGTVEEAQKSDPKYQEIMNSFNFGLNLKQKNPGFDIKKETILG